MNDELSQLYSDLRQGKPEVYTRLISESYVRISAFVGAFCPVPQLSDVLTTEAYVALLADMDSVAAPSDIFPELRSRATALCRQALEAIRNDYDKSDPLLACQIADGLRRLDRCNPKTDDVCVVVQNVYNQSRERVRWVMSAIHADGTSLDAVAAQSRRSISDFLPELFLINMRLAENFASHGPAWSCITEDEWKQTVRRDVQGQIVRYLHDELPHHGIPGLVNHIENSGFLRHVFCQLALVERMLRHAFGRADSSSVVSEIETRVQSGALTPLSIADIVGTTPRTEVESDKLPLSPPLRAEEGDEEPSVGEPITRRRQHILAGSVLGTLVLIFVIVFGVIVAGHLHCDKEPSPLTNAPHPPAPVTPPPRHAKGETNRANLLSNGDFNNKLDGWETIGGVELRGNKKSSGAETAYCYIKRGSIQRYVTGLAPGGKYRLSVWAKAIKEPVDAGIKIGKMIDAKHHQVVLEQEIKGANWKEYTINFTMKKEWLPKLKIYAYQKKKRRSVALDLFRLERLDRTEQTAGHNLLTNGGFEKGLAGWKLDKRARITADAAHGKNALELPSPLSFVTFSFVPAKVGALFACSAQMKTAKGETMCIGIVFRDKKHKELQKYENRVRTKSYKHEHVVAAAPPGTQSAAFFVWADKRRKGSMFVDDLSFREVSFPAIPPPPHIRCDQLKPISATVGWAKFEINRNPNRKPIRLNGKTYAHGLGTHADSKVVYPIPEGSKRFVAVVGLDDCVNSKFPGSVIFKIFGVAKGNSEPQILSKSPLLTSKALRRWAFNVDVTPYQTIHLVTSSADGSNENDHAIWANPGFRK